MDSVLPLFCLILGSVIPLAVVFVLVRRGMRQLQVAHAYGDVSRRLGLSVDTRGVSLHGHLADRRIWIGEVMVGHGPDRRMVVWGVLDMERNLGLGLVLKRRGLSDRLFRRSRAPEISLGNPTLDGIVEVRGDEPTRIRALLTDDVRAALEALMAKWPDVVVTDQSVRVHLQRPEASSDRLEELVDAMVNLSREIEAARRRIAPPARLLKLVDDIEGLGQRLGLASESWLPALAGTLDERRVLVAPRRDGSGYGVEVWVYFTAEQDMGFQLRPQNGPDGYWNVGQDIQVGTPRFDNAFVIKGYDPAKVTSLITAALQEVLLSLSEDGAVEIDDRCVHIRRLPLEIAVIERSVKGALEAARVIGW